MRKFIVITSINKPTEAIKSFTNWKDWQVVVVGDRKTPEWELEGVTFLDIDWQHEKYGEFSHSIGENTYKRKMIGYIYAIQNGADMIFETDDDNYFYTWLNIYEKFGAKNCWPRGFPLEKIGVDQFLVDGDPDVDAVYRMTNNKHVNFKKRKPIMLKKDQHCPFNSQATLWSKDYFPLMFLPLSVTDRVSDILRSFIVQECLWRKEKTVCFHSPIMYQKRNKHNLLEDYKQEQLLYLHADEWVRMLKRIEGKSFEDLFASGLKLLKEDTLPYKLYLELIK